MSNYHRGARFVLFFAFLTVIVVVLVTQPKDSAGMAFIERFQTLIAGLIALLGAAIGAKAIYSQIKVQEKIERVNRSARKDAARALLPLTLSAICDYAEQCAHLAYGLLEECDADGFLPATVPPPDFPSPPSEAIEALKEIVELSEVSERRYYSTLIVRIQILRSRLRSVTHPPRDLTITDDNLRMYVIDAAHIYTRCNATFQYARMPSASLPGSDVSVGDLRSTLEMWSFERVLD